MNNFPANLIKAIKENQPDKLLGMAINYAYHLSQPEIINIMMSIADISRSEFSSEFSSAAIGFKGGRLYLWFNKEFLREYVSTPECLLFVILHELLHKIRGDILTRMNRADLLEQKTLANIAFDLSINSFLIKNYFNKKPVALLKKLYADSQEVLLKVLSPPELLSRTLESRENDRGKIQKEIKEKLTETLPEKNSELADTVLDLYYAAWFKDTSVSALYEIILRIAELLHYRFAEDILITLIGHHNGSDNGEWSKWFKKRFGVYSNFAGYSEKVEEIKIFPQEKKFSALINAIKKAITVDFRHPATREQFLPETGLVPFPGRKEIFMLSSGWRPLYYPNPTFKTDCDEWKTHIYIDVSWSTSDYWHILYGMIIALKELVGSPVYGFSNKVFPLALEDLKHGRVLTTGGTDLDCVIEHAIKNKFRKILVITDGLVTLKDDLLKVVKRDIDIFAIITTDADCSPLVKSIIGEDKKNIKWWSLAESLK